MARLRLQGRLGDSLSLRSHVLNYSLADLQRVRIRPAAQGAVSVTPLTQPHAVGLFSLLKVVAKAESSV